MWISFHVYASADSAVCSFFFFGNYFPIFLLDIISRFFYGNYFPDQWFQGLNILCLNTLSSVIKTMFSQLNPNVN